MRPWPARGGGCVSGETRTTAEDGGEQLRPCPGSSPAGGGDRGRGWGASLSPLLRVATAPVAALSPSSPSVPSGGAKVGWLGRGRGSLRSVPRWKWRTGGGTLRCRIIYRSPLREFLRYNGTAVWCRVWDTCPSEDSLRAAWPTKASNSIRKSKASL